MSASRGITIPRCLSSICVNPEQSNPWLETPPHVYVTPINLRASWSASSIVSGEALQLERFVDCQRRRFRADIAALHPGRLAINEFDLDPARGVIRLSRNQFKARLPGKFQHGSMTSDIRITIDIDVHSDDAYRSAFGSVTSAIKTLQVSSRDPTLVSVRGADVVPVCLLLERKDACPVESLGDNIAIRCWFGD